MACKESIDALLIYGLFHSMPTLIYANVQQQLTFMMVSAAPPFPFQEKTL
jgi:hypothetical protein